MNKMGEFIVICGGDFAGKTTLLESLKADENFKDYLFTREPGNLLDSSNSRVCENIRDIILKTELSSEEEATLFAASRNLHTKDIIDNLKIGKNIICDRYIFSSIGYQSTEGGGDLPLIELLELNLDSIKQLMNNNIKIKLIVLQIDESTLKERKKIRASSIGLDVLELKADSIQKKIFDFYNTDKIIKSIRNVTIASSIEPYLVNANCDQEAVYEIVKKIILK